MEKPIIDVVWVLMSAALVFLMQAGFLCLEAGLTRTKNSINVAIKNVADFGISLLLFWAFGFALMFGLSHEGLIGTTLFFPNFTGEPLWFTTFFIFQVMFCGTAVTIVSGAVAERVRFGAYLIMAMVVSAIIYPIVGHWAWGGAYAGDLGWLAKQGFVDFAGSTVVHSVGGWASLACILIVGPRTGRFSKGAKPREIPGSQVPLAMLGAMLLWFGWIGFNGGSTLAMDGRVGAVIINTMIAASAGLVTSMAMGFAVDRYCNPGVVINGVLAGLVAITANCHCVSAFSAVAIGGIGAIVCFGATRLLDRLRIDDAVSAVPVHLVAGIWGTLAVAIFGDAAILNNGLSFWGQLEVQLLGVATCGLVAFGVMFGAFTFVNRLVRLRVTAHDEQIGLNVAEHHATTELVDFVNVIEQQSLTQDLSLRAPVEPFTEVGQIACRYNALMDILEQSKIDIDDLKATEKLLRDATEAAEMANTAKSEFLANMSHEIRTPLHGILSFAGFGLKKVRSVEVEKIEDYFRKIDISARRLLLMVNDLLDMAKLEAGKMKFDFERADVVMIMASVVDEFTSLLSERGMHVRFERPPLPIFAVIDGTKVMQIVRNLLSNAIKFSPPNSSVDLSMATHGDALRLTVRDHGVGIPVDELKTIFEKFVQSSKTKSGAGGTGLGLAICNEIASAHQGKVWAENHPDGGAMFHFEFPMQRGGIDPSLVKESPREPALVH